MLVSFIRVRISLLSFLLLISISSRGQKGYIPLKIGKVTICGAKENKLKERDLHDEKGTYTDLEFYTKTPTQVSISSTFDEKSRKLAKLIEGKTAEEIDTIVVGFFTRRTMTIDEEQIFYKQMAYGRISKKYTYLDILHTIRFDSVMNKNKYKYLSSYRRWVFIEDKIYRFSCTTGPCMHCRKTAKRSRNVIKKDFRQLCRSIKVEE